MPLPERPSIDLLRQRFIRDAQNRGEAPSPSLCSTSPRTRGEVKQSFPVPAARFLFAPRVSWPTMSLTVLPLRCSPDFTALNPGTKQKGEAERRETHRQTRAAQRGAHPAGCARLSASHCGSCQGDSWSPRLCIRPCFGRQSGAFDPVRPPQPGGGDLALLHGRYPRRKNEQLSPYREHLAHRP